MKNEHLTKVWIRKATNKKLTKIAKKALRSKIAMLDFLVEQQALKNR